ncbi:MAG: glycosyltransferase family 1 protein [Balneolaceae bacterium]
MEGFRIAIFTGNYNHIRDGVSLTLNRLVRYLEEAGNDVLVFGPSIDNPPMVHEGTMEVVPSISMPGRPEYRISLRMTTSNRKRLKAFDPDIVHIATPDLLGLQALRWACRRKIPVTTSYHTHFSSYLSYYNLGWIEALTVRYLKWFYGKAKQVYVPAPSMIEEMKSQGFLGDLRIWARGVDLSLFSPRQRDLNWRRKLGVDDRDLILLFVSRLVWEKNLDIYAKAAKQAMAHDSRIRPMVVGDGPALERLKEILPSAIYTGFLTGGDLARAYASSDIFLFPSVTESFGNVTLEAMASGLPCIVANAAGSKSLVNQGENGYIVDVSSVDSVSTAVIRMADDDSLRKSMGQLSFEKAQKYSWSQINGELLDNYREVLNRNDSK